MSRSIDNQPNHTHINEEPNKLPADFDDLLPVHFDYPNSKSIYKEQMTLSGSINQITKFELSKVKASNLRSFIRLFEELSCQAIMSNRQLVFSRLEEISDHVIFIDKEQRELIDFMNSIQENTINSIHKQIIKITM